MLGSTSATYSYDTEGVLLASREGAPLTVKEAMIVMFTSLCLAGDLIAGILDSPVAEELSLLGLFVPLGLAFNWRLVSGKILSASYWPCLPYLAAIIISILISMNKERHLFVFLDTSLDTLTLPLEYKIVQFLNISFILYFGCAISSGPRPDIYVYILRFSLLIITPILLYVLITVGGDYDHYGRWTPYDLSPNWWGAAALGAGWCALAWRNPAVRLPGLMFCLYFMYKVSSRGSLVAILLGFALGSGYFLPLNQKRIAGLSVLFILLLVLIGIAEFLSPIGGVSSAIADFILNRVFLLDDPYRGTGTGLVGRELTYTTGINLWEDSPFFGVGLGEAPFIHNGFLLVMCETGIFGLLGMLLIMVKSLIAARRRDDLLGLGLIASYLTMMLTFPRAINVNTTGVLFMLVMTGLISGSTRDELVRDDPIDSGSP